MVLPLFRSQLPRHRLVFYNLFSRGISEMMSLKQDGSRMSAAKAIIAVSAGRLKITTDRSREEKCVVTATKAHGEY